MPFLCDFVLNLVCEFILAYRLKIYIDVDIFTPFSPPTPPVFALFFKTVTLRFLCDFLSNLVYKSFVAYKLKIYIDIDIFSPPPPPPPPISPPPP